MALYHAAEIVPSKLEVIAGWVPSQPWCPDVDAPITAVGAFRFDDPEGRVGIETHLVMVGDTLVHVPLTYREAPVDEAAESLIGTMEHSALGTRWVYDGIGDERYIVMLAGVSMTGQGEALGMVVYDGKWFIAPSAVRIRGGGWTQERVSVDGFARTNDDDRTVQLSNNQFDLTFHRFPVAGNQPPMGLTATWESQADPVVLSEVAER